MDLMSFLGEPVVFFGILGGLFMIALAVIVVWARKETRLIHDKEGLIGKINQSFTEVVNKADERERELKKKLVELEQGGQQNGAALESAAQLERECVSLKNENVRLREQCARAQDPQAPAGTSINEGLRQENLDLNRRISGMQKQLDDAKKGITSQESPLITPEELKALRAQLAQANQELSLKDKLYEGLKAQYSELEKSSESIMQQLEEERKSQRLISQKLWDITKPKEM